MYNIDNNSQEILPSSPIIDLIDDEIKDISLQNEISSFHEVYKKVSDKIKDSPLRDNFKEEFQALIKTEISKINSNYESDPNYIYATSVIESQLNLYSFFNDKFLSYLSEKDINLGKLGQMINDNITKSYLLLIKIIHKLYHKITEKTQSLLFHMDDSVKNAPNDKNEINAYENKANQISKEKDILLMQYQEEINMLQQKVSTLENENKIMTEKMIKSAKNILSNNNITSSEPKTEYHNDIMNNNSNISNYNSNKTKYNNNSSSHALNNRKLISKDKQHHPIEYNYNSNFSGKIINNTNFCNDNSSLQSSPVCTKVFTIKMMKETIKDIYNSKAEFDKKNKENKAPRETLEQHMYFYFNHKYGLKQIISEWVSNIINGVGVFSSEDSEIFLFGKILRNEIEEESRFDYANIKRSVLEMLNYFLKNKYPLKSIQDIQSMQKEKENGLLCEEEWKKLIGHLYDPPDMKLLENKIIDVIQKKYLRNKFASEKKLTREEIINLTKIKDEYNIPFKDFIKILHEYKIKTREKYLRNFVMKFKKYDQDNNGIINEEEFINLIFSLNLFRNRVNESVVELLTIIDPNNNKQITFSECVELLSNQPYKDEQGNINGSLLDKVCLEE